MKRSVLILRYLFMILSVMIMALIFFFSSQNGTQSGEVSGGFAEALKSFFEKLNMSAFADFLVTYVRKCAHAFIYAALGLCVTITVLTFDFKHKWLWIVLPVVICFAYACSDEFHQSFINGRDGKFTDVLVDSAGFMTAIIIANLINFFIYRKRQKTDRARESKNYQQ